MNDDTWDIVGDVADALSSSSAYYDDDDDSSSYSGRGNDSGASDSALGSPFLRKLFAATFGNDPNKARRELLRAVVENEGWFVPIRADGSWETIDAEPRQYRLAIEPPSESGKKKRKANEGKGGRLLPLFAEEPACPATRCEGRAAIQAIPADVVGLLLHLPNRAPRELGQEYFADLRDLAAAGDLEAMLVCPGPDQVTALKRARWRVEMSGDSVAVNASLGRGNLVYVYTGQDRVSPNARNITIMEGEILFRLVAENPDVDGILVNSISWVGHGANRLNQPVLSPGFACRILEDEDIRPGANPLPAFSREEVVTWLNLRGFPGEGRTLVDAPLPDALLIRGTTPQGSTWRQAETIANQLTAPGPTWSPVFTLAPNAPETGFAAIPSRILCPGLLARELNATSLDGKDPVRYWRPGRWLLFGRLLSESECFLSQRRLTLATELAKFLPPDADRIPRAALQTVEGATIFRRAPHAATRAWIEATMQQAEKYTRRWVWGG